jgi:uncharacterized membrane protein
MSPSRLEAFSDGVMAVAITLLVLDIHVPNPGGSLAHELGAQWPHYVALVTSFVTIGIIWINHHAMIGRLRAIDHTLMILNLALLLTIVILPFTTSLVAEYVNQSSGQHLAAAIYSGSFLVMAIAFSACQRHILLVKPELLATERPEAERRQIFSRAVTGLVPYVVATAVAPLSAYATLVICAAIAAYYASPFATASERRA